MYASSALHKNGVECRLRSRAVVPHKAGVPWVYRYRRRLKMSGVSFKLGCMDISCVRIEGRTTCSVMRGSSSHASFRTASSFIDCVAAVSLPRFLRPLDASSHHVRRTYQVSLPATKCLASTCGAVRWAMWRRERGSRPHCHRASSTSVNKPHHLFVSMHT